ncbi:MAG TPA: nucleotidyltransferase domain-containing protein [Spirochaetes bacterium]|nr:nucleotidyltransferase domain-containing protein [Spirochaetota bacterium]
MRMIPWNHYKEYIKDYLYLSELERFVKAVILHERPCQIILFGSLAQETYHWDSDIDLFVLFDSPCVFKDMKHQLLKHHTETSDIIDVFPYNIKDFKDLSQNPDLFIYNALKDSVVIYDK